ncbi:uncharacterized protein LOC127425202 [Myxocyprinus asiaticus]|uniref:uncharacterized protein LOC127425202 n=1 Tax=Myxocyprinus asiaticus TaxID=70543 RepID=UPI0022216214|nr:uncharacterized protein LOC127425202 [Myxocyprinus asiaticus]
MPLPTLLKMGVEDDSEAFLDLFECSVVIWGWPRAHWMARLIPLLSREAQLTAQQMPAASLLAYDDLKKSILQRVGRSPERHRGSDRPGGAGAANPSTTKRNGRMSPVPPSGVAGGSCPIGGGPYGSVPEGRRALLLSLPSPYVFPVLFSLPPPLSLHGGIESHCRSRLPIHGGLFPPRLHCPTPSGGCAHRQHSVWASLLELRGSGALPGSMPCDGAGDCGPDP